MKRWEIDAVGRQNLKLNDVEVPKPGPKEVLIKVNAVALNYRDKMVVETGRGLPLTFPFTPGSDLAGEVVGLGQGASRLSIGTGSRTALERFVRAIDQTRIVPVVNSCYSLADLPAAFDHLDRGAFGKIVIDVAE